MNELDQQVLDLTDREVRSALMLLADKHATDVRAAIASVLAVTRKGQ